MKVPDEDIGKVELEGHAVPDSTLPLITVHVDGSASKDGFIIETPNALSISYVFGTQKGSPTS